jgi:GT2 family glycosyltransferase
MSKAREIQASGIAFVEPTPAVSIIIPVYNGIEYVRECIESVYNAPVGVRFEVIVIDQNSQDGAREMLQAMAADLPNFTLIKNSTNVGFGRAVNQGAAVARGEFLAVANSDLVFTPGWLDHLAQAMRNDPQLAVVSPVTNYVGEGPQLDLQACDVTPLLASLYAQSITERPRLQPVEDRLVFFCVLVRKQVFDFLGGLSDVFGLGNYEDDDFCFRARMAGYTLGIVPRAFVFHYGSRTFKEQKIDYVELMQQNEGIFYNRVADFSLRRLLRPFVRNTASPSISVVVRTKDRPALLKQALTSLANQFFEDFEVVVVNDGGADISPVLCEMEPYLRLTHIFHKTPRGRPAALNAGVAAATGQWITYLDDDDIVYPHHLALLASGLSRDRDTQVVYTDANKALLWSDAYRDLATLERTRFISRDFDYDSLLVGNWIPIMAFMHTANSLNVVGHFDETFEVFEDWDLLIRLAQLGPFKHIPRLTCEYRFRFGEIVGDSTLRLREKALNARLLLYTRYPTKDESVLRRRDQTITYALQQINEVREIAAMDLGELQKGYLITAHLGDFPIADFNKT